MPRAQNAYSVVNCGINFKMISNDSSIINKATIVYGGINKHFIHANSAENFLAGKNIIDENVLKSAVSILKGELKTDWMPPDEPADIRQLTALSLFYRAILNMQHNKINKLYKSGKEPIQRPLSSGHQDISTNPKHWPVNQPIKKIDGLIQCAGEAEYLNDIPMTQELLFGALVLTKEATAEITSIDSSSAMKMRGVKAFYTAKDIPGENSALPISFLVVEKEEVFCSGNVKYAGQPVGVMVAKSMDIALAAASAVIIKYKNKKKPLISIKDVLNSAETSRITQEEILEPTSKGNDIKEIIKGEISMGEQYHYTMELQCCQVVPSEGGQLEVYTSTQWMQKVHLGIAQVLGIPENRINIQVRRVGGAFGCKAVRPGVVATACALAAYKLSKPVRMVLSMETNTAAIGKRAAALTKYEVGVNKSGKIQYLQADFYVNSGCYKNESGIFLVVNALKNTYDSTTWSIKFKSVITDIPGSVFSRAPGTLEGITFMENLFEHIANVLKMDPISVRSINMKDETAKTMLTDWKNSTDYDKRLQVTNQFNKENRWKKRGLSIVPMTFPIAPLPSMPCLVSIYYGDGTVAISCGGIEFGQGLTTKVTQVCAYKLGIPLDLIKVKTSNNLISPNCMASGGSFASDIVSFACLTACEELNTRLLPIKEKFPNYSWKELIMQASKEEVNLTSYYNWIGKSNDLKPYTVYGVCCTEVEADVLTGQHVVRRVDILQDAGESLSPLIDLGQVEGAFITGLGYFTSEEIIYDSQTGALLTNRTWNYKPPGAKDIPVDFRITLQKNVTNPNGVLGSKAVSESPLCLAVSVVFALRNAVIAARRDAGLSGNWFQLNSPCTVAEILRGTGTKGELFKLY